MGEKVGTAIYIWKFYALAERCLLLTKTAEGNLSSLQRTINIKYMWESDKSG